MSTRNQTASGGPTLQFTPYDEQRDVLESDVRFRVVAAGRRSGKTLMAAVETVRRALEGGSNWRGYWVGAEHRHADTAFRTIDAALPDRLVARRNQSPPRTIELVSGATIEFHTAGGGALVSIGLDWAVCDEAGKNFPERSWTQELRPALSDRQGSAMFISTPDGRGWFHDRYERGQTDDYPDWASWRWPTYANPYVPDDEIDSAKANVPDRIFRQEYLAEFIDESGGVFSDLDRRLFTADYDLAEFDGTGPYAHGWDLARHEDYLVGIVLDAEGRVVHFHRSGSRRTRQVLAETKARTYRGFDGDDRSRGVVESRDSTAPTRVVHLRVRRDAERVGAVSRPRRLPRRFGRCTRNGGLPTATASRTGDETTASLGGRRFRTHYVIMYDESDTCRVCGNELDGYEKHRGTCDGCPREVLSK